MKSATRKTMRVATVFTGAAAVTAGFAPSALANTRVPQPYRLTVYVGADVQRIQVCAYQSPAPGHWTCTPIRNPTYHYSTPYGDVRISGSTSFGTNWRDGKVNVWVWGYSYYGTMVESGYTCNTNGAYYGHFKANGGVSLTGSPGAIYVDGLGETGYAC
jgi:hypothetical protein